MKVPAPWSMFEMFLAALSVAVFIHAYRFETYDWEMYAAVAIGAAALVVSTIGFRKRTDRMISVLSGMVALIVLGQSATEIALAYAFTGHLP